VAGTGFPGPPTQATAPDAEAIRVGVLELRRDDREAFVDGRRASLTLREFEVLEALSSRPDRVVGRDAIYERVWGGQMPRRDRAVDVHIRRIRSKLQAIAPEWAFIHTHFGIGYRLFPERLPDVAAPDSGSDPRQTA